MYLQDQGAMRETRRVGKRNCCTKHFSCAKWRACEGMLKRKRLSGLSEAKERRLDSVPHSETDGFGVMCQFASEEALGSILRPGRWKP